jgi:uncharacterized protein involved in response to NO
MTAGGRIGLKDIAIEPFRIFLPAAVLVGILAVSLWPLHFGGIVAFYPGIAHAQLMAHGFFGGFIFGVLGTGLPRMLSVKPFSLVEVLLLFAIYAAMVVLNLSGRVTYAAMAALVLLATFFSCAIPRIIRRKDLPPPGFVLVGLALLCLAVGSGLSIAETYRAEETPVFWITLQRLLSYQGFVLLPILGVGGFLLPRFFDLPNTHEFEESRTPVPAWKRKAGLALAAGVAVIVSFFVEASGRERLGHAIRFVVVGAYLLSQVPIYRSAIHKNTIRACLTLAISLMLLGFLAVTVYPVNRVAVLHMTLVGGFAVLSFGVATRVVFGHSGNQSLLARPNRWLWVAVGLMVLGMATRISGDFFPQVRVSHYNYGAAAWIIGTVVWATYVLSKVLVRDPDDS